MNINLIGLGILIAAGLAGRAEAVETGYGAGTKALSLQQSGGTARAMGMGSAVVGVPQGAASLLWNPAGLGRLECKEAGLHHNSGLAGAIQEVGVIGMPLGEVKQGSKEECASGGSLGGLAASLGYVNYGKFDGADSAGALTGTYQAGEYSGSLGWGKTLWRGFSAGVAARANKSNLASNDYYSFTSDLGVLWNVIPSLDLGLSYTNLNIGKKLGGSQPASGLRLGAGWNATKHWLLAASGELQNKAVRRVQLGTEYVIGNIDDKGNDVFLRGGYQLNYPDPELTGFAGLTLGLGYTLTKNLVLDYAMLPMGELGVSHRFSLTYKFSCPQPAPTAVVAPLTVVPVTAAVPVVLKAIVLEDSHFDFDKSTLRPEGMAALKENIEILRVNPKARVRVAGYTSMRGAAEYNQLLSERRAAAVEHYLVTEGGIAPGRITSVGYGEQNPKAIEVSGDRKDMNSAAAKSNMRVLFEIIVK